MKDLIGFFDSGVGGISVLHTAMRLLPNENFLFYGDNKNAPYGTRPVEEIRALSERAISYLLDEGVKAIVIACNTATSAYAEILRGKVDIPVVGMEPAIKPAQEAKCEGEVIALATRATLSLPKFQRLMSLYGKDVTPVVGEGFVELVESGRNHTPEADRLVKDVLAPYMGRRIDSIVLGCTHYPFLKDSIQKAFPGVKLFDGLAGTSAQLKRLLENHGLRSSNHQGSLRLESSGGDGCVRLMERLLNEL